MNRLTVCVALVVAMSAATMAIAQQAPSQTPVVGSAQDATQIKALCDGFVKAWQGGSVPQLTNLIHEQAAFWQRPTPAQAEVLDRDKMVQVLVKGPMPAGVTVGEVQCWVSGTFAFAVAPLVFPEALGITEKSALETILVRGANQWQIVCADLVKPDAKTPAFEGATAETNQRVQQAFDTFRNRLMGEGTQFLVSSCVRQAVLVMWADLEQRLVVGSADALFAEGGQMVGQVTLQPTAQPQFHYALGSGVAVLGANVNVGIGGFNREMRLFIFTGYEPQSDQWRIFGLAAAPPPPTAPPPAPGQ